MATSNSQSESQSQYDQDVKQECRKSLIEHAVRCLTAERDTSVCVERSHVGNVWIHLQETELAKQNFSPEDRLFKIPTEIENWQLLHESHTGIKKPSDLRVCYLAGDNPINDLKVFIKYGVLARNVVAIEKDTETFKKAEKAIGDSDYKCVKLFNGDILDFLKWAPGDFDIIYFDACGSLPSTQQKTLMVIGYIFQYNKLRSPGALITNFSFPSGMPVQVQDAPDKDKEMKKMKDIEEERRRIKSLAENYLKYRLLNSLDKNVDILSTMTDEDIYSDYITYQVIDSAYLYIPAYRMLLPRSGRSSKSPLWDQLFVTKDDFLEKVKLYDLQASKGHSDILESAYVTASASYLRKIGSIMITKKSTNPFCQAWAKEIFPDWMSSSLNRQNIPSMLLTHHVTCEESFVREFANEDFKENCLKHIFGTDYRCDGKITSLCDELDPSSATRLVGGLLYGQLAWPSFPVLNKLLRLRYTARERQMFSDVFIFDKCRYIFDQFPSVNRALVALNEPKYRMVLMMALDGLRSHLKQICHKDFWNVVDMHGAIFHQIPQREMIPTSFDLMIERLQQLGDRLTLASSNNSASTSAWMKLFWYPMLGIRSEPLQICRYL